MTPEELDEIEARAKAAWTQMQTMTGRPPPEAHVAAVTALGRATADTAALVAEVRRLKATLGVAERWRERAEQQIARPLAVLRTFVEEERKARQMGVQINDTLLRLVERWLDSTTTTPPPLPPAPATPRPR